MIEAGLVDQAMFNPSFEGWDFQAATPVPALGIGAWYTWTFVVGHGVWSIAVPIALVGKTASPPVSTPTASSMCWEQVAVGTSPQCLRQRVLVERCDVPPACPRSSIIGRHQPGSVGHSPSGRRCLLGRRHHLDLVARFGVPNVPVSIYLLKRGTLPSLRRVQRSVSSRFDDRTLGALLISYLPVTQAPRGRPGNCGAAPGAALWPAC